MGTAAQPPCSPTAQEPSPLCSQCAYTYLDIIPAAPSTKEKRENAVHLLEKDIAPSALQNQ